MIPEAVLSAVQGAQRILIVSHIDPDGDAYGSMLGLKWVLQSAGKDVVAGLDAASDGTYAFLPGHAAIRRPPELEGAFDLVIITDSSSEDRMGGFRDLPAVQQTQWVVIDHHPTNTFFGGQGLNWVGPEHVSSCNMIVRLSKELGYDCGPRAKKCLLTGMITDSQCFRVFGVNEEFIQDVMEVMGPESFRLYDVVSQTLCSQSFSDLQIWARVLPSLRLEENVVWLTLVEADLVPPGERVRTGGLIQKLTEVKEAAISAVFTERTHNDGRHGVVCSFRCRPHLDVSELAHRYGGGGHQLASGCFVEAPLAVVVEEVVADLQALAAEQRFAPAVNSRV